MLQYLPAGDAAMIIKAGNEISVATHLQVRKLVFVIELMKILGLLDLVPAYTDVMVYYDPAITDYKTLLKLLRQAENSVAEVMLPDPSVLHVPVLYGGNYGNDLNEVAARNNLSKDEVIRIHSSVDYLVYMLGFTPGFCYLGGLNPKIAIERRQNPRLKVPSGSVGIAGNQTGIYPVESPGGWQIIGRTPLKMFDPERDPVFLVNAGDYIRFIPIDESTFLEISNDVKKGWCQVQKETLR